MPQGCCNVNLEMVGILNHVEKKTWNTIEKPFVQKRSDRNALGMFPVAVISSYDYG